MDTLLTQLDPEWNGLIRRPEVGVELAEASALAGAQLPEFVRILGDSPAAPTPCLLTSSNETNVARR